MTHHARSRIPTGRICHCRQWEFGQPVDRRRRLEIDNWWWWHRPRHARIRLLSTATWGPRLQVLRRLDRLRLCLFFMTASRGGRGICCYKLKVEEPTPARRCLSWSLADTSSYRSKTRIFSAVPHIANRAFSDSTVPPHGQITWYINCWASMITTSGSWSLTPSLSTSGALLPREATILVHKRWRNGT